MDVSMVSARGRPADVRYAVTSRMRYGLSPAPWKRHSLPAAPRARPFPEGRRAAQPQQPDREHDDRDHHLDESEAGRSWDTTHEAILRSLGQVAIERNTARGAEKTHPGDSVPRGVRTARR